MLFFNLKEKVFFLLMLSLTILNNNAFAKITVEANYENAHAVNPKVKEPDTIEMGPIYGHKEAWFNFRIKGVKNKKIYFILRFYKAGPDYLTIPKVTYDNKGYENVKEISFIPENPDPPPTNGEYIMRFSHIFKEDEAFVSYCVPYTNGRLASLVDKLKTNPCVKINKMGDSKFNKFPLTYFRVTDKNVSDKYKKGIYIMGREDSYEVGGSWLCEGILRFITSNDPVAKELIKKTIFYVMPIFSVDGVAGGWENFPLTPDGSDYIYVTATWNKKPLLHEASLVSDFLNNLKKSGESIDISLRCHSTCYSGSDIQHETTKERKSDTEVNKGLNTLSKMIKDNLCWYNKKFLRIVEDRFSWFIIQIFPKVLTFASHSDFSFAPYTVGNKDYIPRRNEDILQDGELFARAIAKFYGIESKETAPFLMGADIDKNCGKRGDTVIFSAYYYDLNGLPPSKVEIYINSKPYQMSRDEMTKTDESKPSRYILKFTLSEPRNDYYLIVSNGKKERRIPEDEYLLPGPFLIE